MNKSITVQMEHNADLFQKITSNFIYNRYDLQKSNIVYLLKVEYSDSIYYIPLKIHYDIAAFGIELAQIEKKVIKKVVAFVFHTFKNIKQVILRNVFFKYGLFYSNNYFTLDLPDNISDLESRLSRKARYNLKREMKMLSDEAGEVSFLHTDVNDNLAREILDVYFSFKQRTHNINYNLTYEEYIDKFFVTDMYYLSSPSGILAIILSCEQCDGVYVENMSFDVKYSHFSPGQILYHEYIKTLISRNKKTVFLSGGYYDYKKRYNSTENIVFTCKVKRNIIRRDYDFLFSSIKYFTKKNIKSVMKKFLEKRRKEKHKKEKTIQDS